MQISFLGHGINSGESLGSVLIESFLNTDFNKFSCLVAFASASGIYGVRESIQKSKNHIRNFDLVIGIDHRGTSKEALQTLLDLDISTRVYYTFSPVTFHPKIYIFEGEKKGQIILGSSNLTRAGLFQNIEASLIIDYEKPDEEGEILLSQIYSFFKSFFEGEDQNLQKLTQELIQDLFEGGLVPSEPDRIKIQEKETILKTLEKADRRENVLKKLKEEFPTIKVQKPPERFKDVWDFKGRLLWKKTNLPASDVQLTKEGTSPTGCLRLTQSGWRVDNQIIDQTSYFKEDVFGDFEWELKRTTPRVDVARILFRVKISSEDMGEYLLKVRHKPSGEAGQGNYTTSLSWGELGDLIRDSNLKDKTLSVFAPEEGKKEPFYIEIE